MEVGLGESNSYNKHHCTECVCADVHYPGFVVLLGRIQHKQNSPSNQPASWQKQWPLPPVCPGWGCAPSPYTYLWSTKVYLLMEYCHFCLGSFLGERKFKFQGSLSSAHNAIKLHPVTGSRTDSMLQLFPPHNLGGICKVSRQWPG